MEKESVEDLLKRTLEEATPTMTEAELKTCETLLRKIIIDKISMSEALKLTPEGLELIYTQGYHQFNSGRYRDAIIYFSLLVAMEPTNAKYMMAYAAVLHREKEYKDAISAYLSCYYLDPLNPLSTYHLADCYEKTNDTLNAIDSLALCIIQCLRDEKKYKSIKEKAKLLMSCLASKIGMILPTEEEVDKIVKDYKLKPQVSSK